MRFVFFTVLASLFYIGDVLAQIPDATKDTLQKDVFKTKNKRFYNESTHDTLWNDLVYDPYRRLEATKDSLVFDWYDQQNEYTREVLAALNERTHYEDTLRALFSRPSTYISNSFIAADGTYFYLKYDEVTSALHLYKRSSFERKEILLFNPTTFKAHSNDSLEYTINYIRPNWDGTYVAMALSHSGNEFSQVKILDVSSKTLLPVTLTQCKPKSYFGIDWLPNNKQFTYLHFFSTENERKREYNSASVLYTIGQTDTDPKVIFGASNNPSLEIGPSKRPVVDIPSGDAKYAFAYVSDVTNYWDVYYKRTDKLSGQDQSWKELFSKEDLVYRNRFQVYSDTLYYMATNDRSETYIASKPLSEKGIKNSRELIRNSEYTIKDLVIIRDLLFYSATKNGVEAKLFQFDLHTQESKEIDLPFNAGSIDLDRYGNDSDKHLEVYLSGWTNDGVVYRYDIENVTFTDRTLSKKPAFPEFESIVSEEILIKGHDGVLIPLSLVYTKSTEKNGSHPVWLTGYGAYGDNSTPSYSPVMLKFVSEGGIYALAHVRGGGEKGDTWHKDGQKEKKSNSWKDMISCTQYLIDQKYTSAEHIAILGGSAGAITTARAVLERPDLYNALIVSGGVLNPLRREQISESASTVEYGSIKLEEEYKGLKAMDAYLNLKKNVSYPATLTSVGWNDERVEPWMSGKFVAKMQDYNASEEPILLRIGYDEGHRGGSSVDSFYTIWTDIMNFILWKTGHPDYQPKKEAPE